MSLGLSEAMRVSSHHSYLKETVPITEWYCGQSPKDPPSKRRRIRSTWFEQRENFKDFTKPLPPGWTRRPVSATSLSEDEDECHIYPDGCGDYIFKHSAMDKLDNKDKEWYYPFPVADIQVSTPMYTPEHWPYLFCKTKRVQLRAKHSNANVYGDKSDVRLYNNDGFSIGYLQLHNSEQRNFFTATDDTASDSDGHDTNCRMIEVVALFKLIIYRKASKEGNKYRLPPSRREEYFVIWVEWENGVALRRAGGQVNAEAWDELELEDVDLVLG